MTDSPALEFHEVTRRYGDEDAVSRVSLSLDPGSVCALVGLNGAGKTTLMRLALGMARPDAGRVRVFGHDVGTAPSVVWRRVGHLVETPFAYPELSVAENLTVAARLHGLSSGSAHEAVGDVLGALDLRGLAQRRARALSLGNRQRVGLAAAIVHRPDLLVLDEPTNALDPAGVVLLRDLVRELAREGTAVLVSSHHLDEVSRVADRIVVLHAGTLVGDLPVGGHDLERAFFALVLEADRDQGDRRTNDGRGAGVAS